MMEQKKTVAGLELGAELSQLCFYDNDKRDAVSAFEADGPDNTLFPTLLFFDYQSGEWAFGREALFHSQQREGVLVDHLYELCTDGKPLAIRGTVYSAGQLLGIFLRLSLAAAGLRPGGNLEGMVLTAKRFSRFFVRAAQEAFRSLGFSREQAFLQTFNESFYYHTLYQKKELWSRKTALFLFRHGKITFFSLEVRELTRPRTVYIREGDSVPLPSAPEEKDDALYRLLADSIGSEPYSSIFLMGRAFEASWAVRSIPAMCKNNRKVFAGDNLYAKGACFSAAEKLIERKLGGYLYIGEDLVRCNVGMELKSQGAVGYYPIITAGINWYDAENTFEILLDGDRDLSFRVSRIDDKKRRIYSMALPGLPERPPKATKLRVHVEFDSPGRCLIDAEDLGLGELFPGTGRIWHETLEE